MLFIVLQSFQLGLSLPFSNDMLRGCEVDAFRETIESHKQNSYSDTRRTPG